MIKGHEDRLSISTRATLHSAEQCIRPLWDDLYIAYTVIILINTLPLSKATTILVLER